MSWEDERIDVLKRLWNDEGMSASQVADRINAQFPGAGLTRNSIVSKVHRLRALGTWMATRETRAGGTPRRTRRAKPSSNFNRAKAAPPVPAARVGAVEVAYVEPVAPYVPKPEIEVPLSQRKTLQELEESSCRWPIGDPLEEGFTFCGAQRALGQPYCEPHCRVAFEPPKPLSRAPGVAGRAFKIVAPKTPEEVQ